MRLPGPGGCHLTYCTNIHPGESWAEVRSNLEHYVLPVRERVAPGQPFGLGLRLSDRAARELAERERFTELRAFFRERDLYLFTLNGFPYGTFHGQPVKEQVYRPDWLEEARLDYTNRLADLLASLLPEGMEGTISTVPGAFAPRVAGAEGAARIAAQMARHVGHLMRVRETTERQIALAVEPEPCCYLETVAETVEFFQRYLFASPGINTLAQEVGCSPTVAEDALREHVGLCFDTCHMAVEYEDPAAALEMLEQAGIRLAKVQVSAGLQAVLPPGGDTTRDALQAFADDVYLHQVVERSPGGELRRYLDLPEALSEAAREPDRAREWRIHFHVPLFRPHLGPFQSTQDYVRESLELLREHTDCRHFEVETYTWDVLPDEYRSEGIVAAVARELEWACSALQGLTPSELGTACVPNVQAPVTGA